jgi:hypothetical protein
MTAIHTSPIVHASAWTPAETGGKEGLLFRLPEEALDALDILLADTSKQPIQSVTRRDFSHPVIDPLLQEIRSIIMKGRGIVAISGIPPERYDAEALERIFWGFGTHLGTAATQSARGDRLGYVEARGDDLNERGYRSNNELRMHTDSYEVVGLMCIRKAAVGGLSGVVSSLSIHNEILATDRSLLGPLYRGFRYASGEAKFSSKPITDQPIPIFAATGDQVSCTYERMHIAAAAAILGQELPEDLVLAMNHFDELAIRDDLCLRFQLEPGEILLWNNYTNLHSRTEFKDDQNQRRLLLRLWLTMQDGRVVDPALRIRADTYERVYKEASAHARSCRT